MQRVVVWVRAACVVPTPEVDIRVPPLRIVRAEREEDAFAIRITGKEQAVGSAPSVPLSCCQAVKATSCHRSVEMKQPRAASATTWNQARVHHPRKIAAATCANVVPTARWWHPCHRIRAAAPHCVRSCAHKDKRRRSESGDGGGGNAEAVESPADRRWVTGRAEACTRQRAPSPGVNVNVGFREDGFGRTGRSANLIDGDKLDNIDRFVGRRLLTACSPICPILTRCCWVLAGLWARRIQNPDPETQRRATLCVLGVGPRHVCVAVNPGARPAGATCIRYATAT